MIQVVIHSHFSHWTQWPALHPVCTQSTQKAVNGHMLNQNHFQLMYHQQHEIRVQTLVLLRQETRQLSMKLKSRHKFWVEVLNKIHLCLSALLQSPKCRARHSHHSSQRVSLVQVDSSSTPLEAARVTHQPSTPSTTEATSVADNQLDVMLSLQQNVDQGVAQQPGSTNTQAYFSRDQRRDDQLSSQIPTIEEQPSPAATYHQSMILSLIT